MSDQKQNDIPSFYPSSIDNSGLETPEEVRENEAHTLFIKELYHLTNPGPFLDNEGRVALRGFTHKDVTLFGFLIEETTDAFLVLLPASLSRDSEGVKATQVIASPIARIMKASVGIMCLPTPAQTLYYLSLVYKQLNTCPGYFTKTRIRQIDNLIGVLKIALGVVQSTPAASSKKEPVAASDKTTFRIPDDMVPRTSH